MSEHYFSSKPAEPREYVEREVVLRGIPHRVVTASGVFSAERLDKATAVFLDKVPTPALPPQAHVLDIGCGWGPISLALADAYPHAHVWASDVNERARELTRVNLETAGHPHATVLAPEELFAHVKAGSIHLIWSNPPIRIGKDALHKLLLDNLALLHPQGVAYCVVGKNLGADSLASWLNTHGYTCLKFASSKGFRILEVRP